jgi:hypothetical protein
MDESEVHPLKQSLGRIVTEVGTTKETKDEQTIKQPNGRQEIFE